MFFSVIMPYYKNRKVIERSVQSVLAQTYSKFELVIVDDGSDDDIAEYIQSVHDDRIKLIAQENRGVSVARNVAINNSSGDWLCFLDSDDEWLPHHLECLVKMHMVFPHANFLLTGHKRIGNTIEISSQDFTNSEADPFLVDDFLHFLQLCPNAVHTNSVCLKKELVLKCGLFAEGVSKGEDTDLWYRCSLYTPVVLTKEVTTIYYRENSFLTKNKTFNFDWVFLTRTELLSDETISLQKRETLQLIWQKYRLSMCKHYLADGDKEKCGQLLKKIKQNLPSELKKEFFLVKCVYLIPGSGIALQRYFKNRQKKY